ECYRQAITFSPKFALAHMNLGNALSAKQDFHSAAEKFEQALALDPKHPGPHNNLAWLLATCPDLELRDPRLAVLHAKKAVELRPMEGNFHNTLAVALYRAGQWKRAIAALEESMSKRNGGDAFDYFFLAMAHRQLGHNDEARNWLEKAIKWVQENEKALMENKINPEAKRVVEELHRFRAEAEEMMK